MSGKVLPYVLVVCLALSASVAYADIETGLVGYWPLNGDATDESGNGLDGTINGDVTPVADRSGEPDSAMQFSGASDAYIDVGDPPELQLTGEMTLAAWVYLDSSNSDNGRIVGKMAGGGSRSWSLNIEASSGGITNPGNFFVASDGNTLVNILTQDSLPTDEWVHLAGVYRPGEAVEIYVNGVLDNANTSGIPASQFSTNGQPVYIGNRTACGNCGWLGFLDEVRIYERALTEDEIRQVMTGNVVSAGPDQWIEAGSSVTLYGSGPEDATSFTWEQIIVGDEPAITIDDPHSSTITFLTPVREIGYVLTLRLTVVSPSEGTNSDEAQIYVRAPNEPRVTPGNFRTYPSNLGYRLEWDWLIDAVEYGVGLKVGPGTYFWFWTPNTYYDLLNLTEGQGTEVAVRARNTYGEGPISDDVTLIPMRNYALPAGQGGINPPDDYVYVVSHYTITDMNNTEIEDDNNDSWNGAYKAGDYWGYLWAAPVYIDHVTYFTGNMFGDGGWFLDLKVQYTQDGTTWIDVPTAIRPAYDFTNQRQGKPTYSRYDMDIPTLYGMGLRVYGTPGGTASFTSIAELEVFADMKTSRPLVVQGIDGEVPERNTGTIDASFSFSTRGDITSMIYQQISGPSVTIEVTGNPLVATFQAPGVDVDTELVFQITGSDGTDTLSDEVTIVVKNLVTTAVAGPDQKVPEGIAVTLDGSGSLTTTGTLTYQWAQTSGDPVTLENPNAELCTFDAPIIWNYLEELAFRLDVNDGAGGTSSDEVIVTIQNSLAYPAWPYVDAAALNTGYMTDLLHLGDSPTDRVLGPLNISADQLAKWGGEAFVNAVPGEQYDFSGTGVTVTRNPMTWTPLHSDDGFFGDEGLDNFQQYYHAYVISPEERPVRLHYRHDDEVRGWNNGVQVINRDGWDNNAEQVVDATLYEGLNSITIKFQEGSGGNYVALGITDEFDDLMDDVWYSLGPSFILADAYAVRELPTSYQPGETIEVTLSVRVNPDNKPSNLTIIETIPALGEVREWTFSGAQVETRVLTYTLSVPAGTTGSLNFTGTVSFPTTDGIKGDKVIYEVPSAPQNLDVEMLLSAYLSWSASPEESVVGYRVYRSVNAGAWEEVALVTTSSYEDTDVVADSTYNYHVAAVNAAGVEGPTSEASGEQMITMVIREAENFNYGGGKWPFEPGVTTEAAIEAPSSTEVGTPAQYDFFFANDFPVGDPAREYRPLDNVRTAVRGDARYIGSITPGDWWRYTLEVPPPGASDPPGGWVKLVVRVSSPGGGTLAAYWDEDQVATVSFVTGDWGNFQAIAVEDQFQTDPGSHTLRVTLADGEMNVDTIGIGFNWTKPTREDLFADDFETYSTLYVPDDLVAAGYTVVNGGGEPLGAWRLWNTTGDDLGAESPAVDAMTGNYVITDSDLAGAVEVDEELITPAIDCTNHRGVRLDFNYNYRAYPDDTTHAQIAEVDVRTSEDGGTTWSDWTNLAHWDAVANPDIVSGSMQVNMSALADGKVVQIRFHYYEANFDYWFAVDDLRVSGDKLPEQPEEGNILSVGYTAGVADLTWEEFGDGNYTVEYTNDLTSGNWQPVPDQTWPITNTTWSGNIDTIFGQGVYLRVRSE